MDFIEEITPDNITLKILFKKWKFLAFNKKGNSVYADDDEKELLHKIPNILMVGNDIKAIRNFTKKYYLFKIRDGNIIFPYRDLSTNSIKYIFIKYDEKVDLVPVRITQPNEIATAIKNIDSNIEFDFIIIGKDITKNDIILLKSRFKSGENHVISALRENHLVQLNKLKIYKKDKIIDLNILSENPVFLSRIHLREMNISKINQLLLDFDLSAMDAEYIQFFISDTIKNFDPEDKTGNISLLKDINSAFIFYIALLQKNNDIIKKMILKSDDKAKLAPYRTLISKVMSLFPNKEDQLLFTDYDNYIHEKFEELEK